MASNGVPMPNQGNPPPEEAWRRAALAEGAARLERHRLGAASPESICRALDDIRKQLEDTREFGRNIGRRLGAFPSGMPYVTIDSVVVADTFRGVSVLSDGRFLAQDKNGLSVWNPAVSAAERRRPLLDGDYRIEAVEVLSDNRVIVATNHAHFDREVLLLSEDPRGIWSQRGLAYDWGGVRAIFQMPGSRLLVASTRGLGEVRNFDGAGPVTEWFGSSECGPSLDAFLDGRIVVVQDRSIVILERSSSGAFRETLVGEHFFREGDVVVDVRIARALAGGQIASCDQAGALRVWTEKTKGQWSSELLIPWRDNIVSLQALPDGGFVAIDVLGVATRWYLAQESIGPRWRSVELFNSSAMDAEFGYFCGEDGTWSFRSGFGQALPDGRVIFAGSVAEGMTVGFVLAPAEADDW